MGGSSNLNFMIYMRGTYFLYEFVVPGNSAFIPSFGLYLYCENFMLFAAFFPVGWFCFDHGTQNWLRQPYHVALGAFRFRNEACNYSFLELIGHPEDFKQWAKISGDPRWKYENVLEFFKMSEDYVGQWDNGENRIKKYISGNFTLMYLIFLLQLNTTAMEGHCRWLKHHTKVCPRIGWKLLKNMDLI